MPKNPKKQNETDEVFKIMDDEIERLEGKVAESQLKIAEYHELLEEANNRPPERQLVVIPEKFTKQINWKDLHAYIMRLSEETHFADTPEVKFDRMVIFTRREFEKEFHFSDLPLYLPEDEIDVIGQAASAWMVRIAWLPDNVPLMLVAYTERDIEGFMDIIIDANAIKTLKEKVLERMHLNMLNRYRMFQNMVDEAKFMAKRDRENYELVLRKFRTRLALLDNDTESRIGESDYAFNKWQLFGLSLGWVLFIALLLYLIFSDPGGPGSFGMTNSTTNATTPTPTASLTLGLLNLLRMWFP